MTSPNGFNPEGAYVSGGSGQSGLSDLNDLTEGVAKQRMQGALVPSFSSQRDGLWGVLNAAAQSVANVFNGFFSIFFPPTESVTVVEVVDGQLEINNRLDLLANNGYCSLVMDKDYYVSNGNLRALPFTYQVGPRNFAEPVVVNRQHPGAGTQYRDECCIRLDRAGLWQASVNMIRRQSEWESFAEIVVLKPDLTPYTYLSLPTPRGNALGTTGDDPPSKGAPINLFKMFVIPEPGYYVQVRFMGISGGIGNLGRHGIRGGAKYSQFAVTQWSSRTGNGNAPDNPTGTFEDD